MKKVIIFLLVLILLIQIVNIFVLHAIYDWIFICTLFISLLIFAITYVFGGYYMITKAFKDKKYDYVISKENCYLAKNTALKDHIMYMVALSYLEKDNVDGFSRCVDKIEAKSLYLSKCFLKIIHSIIVNNKDAQLKWEEKYNRNETSPQKDRYDEILDLIRKSQLQEYEWSAEELTSIKSIKINSIKNIITPQ